MIVVDLCIKYYDKLLMLIYIIIMIIIVDVYIYYNYHHHKYYWQYLSIYMNECCNIIVAGSEYSHWCSEECS